MNGNIIGKDNTPVVGNTGGIWSLSEQSFYKKNNLWGALPEIAATGGVITDFVGYRYHTFTASSTFTVTSGGSIEYIVIAGGGGSGANSGGGGGAGGVVTGSTSVANGQSYAVTVGSGGNGSTSGSVRGSSGTNSSFSNIATAIAGGGGASRDTGPGGFSGGSGGGGGGSYYSGGTTGGAGTSGQGNSGGTGLEAGISSSGGGGGGYASAGTNSSSKQGGNGGNGFLLSPWTSSTGQTGYAGGGCGSALDYSNYGGKSGSVQAGYGGGGKENGSRDGRANSGGGGGGLGNGTNTNDAGGGNGGSGIVILRYPYSGPPAPVPQVQIINGASPSPQTLTGGIYRSANGNGTTVANWTVNADNIRMAWPTWSDSRLRTNNTFNLTGMTKYEIDYESTGFSSQYAWYEIYYPNTSGTYVTAGPIILNGSGDGPRTTKTVNLSQPPGTGQIEFRGGNSFGDIYVYSLIFKGD